ncbi:hypothetical protein IQ06DRAFT_67925 [Phaeosphaeriaceae sp. SRC1lsM3a]|nr:hypothetical protein IQ06DRAFT_67925 [Stagonospora sp. SRC1lsM3a]
MQKKSREFCTHSQCSCCMSVRPGRIQNNATTPRNTVIGTEAFYRSPGCCLNHHTKNDNVYAASMPKASSPVPRQRTKSFISSIQNSHWQLTWSLGCIFTLLSWYALPFMGTDETTTSVCVQMLPDAILCTRTKISLELVFIESWILYGWRPRVVFVFSFMAIVFW